MKSLKKFAALAITGALCLTSAVSALAADFSDMPSGEMGQAIENAVNNGLLTGYEDGTVKPNDYITRAQMSAIIVRAFGVTEKAKSTFGDVADSAWYKESVQKAVYMGAFKGDEQGNFNPENNITFQETYTVLARVFQFEGRTTGTGVAVMTPDANCLQAFPDNGDVAGWATDYTKAVVGNGGYKGIGGMLKPTQSITRGEFAMVMDQLVSMYIDNAGAYDLSSIPAVDGSIIVRAGGVDIKNLNENNNIIFSYGVDKKTTLTDSTIKGCVVIYGGTDKSPISINGVTKADESFISIIANIYDCRIFAPNSETVVSPTNEDVKKVFIKAYEDTAVVNLGTLK